METYLTLLYVTIEQEVALKELFLSKGWLYAKPDLSVLTSNVGPPESFTSTGGIVKFTDDNGATEQRAKIVHPKVVENEDGIVEDTCVKVEYDDEYGGDTDEVLTGQDYDDDDYNADDHDDDDDFADLVEAAEPVNEAPKETRKSPRNRSKKTKAKSVLTNQKTAQVISFQADGSLAQTVKETPKSKKRKVDGAEVGEGEAVDREDMMDCSEKKDEDQSAKIQCEDCTLTFTSVHGLSVHMGRSHGKKPSMKSKLVCHICGSVFTRNDSLQDHVRFVHLGQPRRKTARVHCDICGKSFGRKCDLQDHKAVKHLDGSSLRYKCSQCNKSFSRRWSLNAHCNNRHAGKYFVECEKCGKQFNSLYNMNKHTKAGFCYGNERANFKCFICDKRVHTKSSLEGHLTAVHFGGAFHCLCGVTIKWDNDVKKHTESCHEYQEKFNESGGSLPVVQQTFNVKQKP